MKFATTLAVCLVAGVGSLAAAQQQQTPPPPPPPQEVSMIGCLVQGSQPSVFLLENARPATGTTQDTGTRYLVVSDSKDVDLLSHVNREVQLTGQQVGPVPPPEKPVPERDLPTLRARALTLVSNSCPVHPFEEPLEAASQAPPVSGAQARAQQAPKELTFEGCLTKGAEGQLLLTNAHSVGGVMAGAGLRFRLQSAHEGIPLQPHLNHVVQITGPLEGVMPPAGRTVPDRELPLIRVKTLSMISNECLIARRG